MDVGELLPELILSVNVEVVERRLPDRDSVAGIFLLGCRGFYASAGA